MSSTHDYEQVFQDENEDDAEAEDIELVGHDGSHHSSAPPLPPSSPVLMDRILLLILITLIVGYKWGMKDGKAQVEHLGANNYELYKRLGREEGKAAANEEMNDVVKIIESNSKELHEIREVQNNFALKLQQLIDHEDSSSSQMQNDNEGLEIIKPTTINVNP